MLEGNTKRMLKKLHFSQNITQKFVAMAIFHLVSPTCENMHTANHKHSCPCKVTYSSRRKNQGVDFECKPHLCSICVVFGEQKSRILFLDLLQILLRFLWKNSPKYPKVWNFIRKRVDKLACNCAWKRLPIF